MALVATLSACVAQPQPAMLTPAVAADPLLGVWEYPASEFPTMCIAFLPEGELRFHGGFLFFNPGRWKKSANDGTVQLQLGGASPFPFAIPGRQLAHRVGGMVSAIPGQRVLVYRIDADTASIDFAGFIFYRKAACAAE